MTVWLFTKVALPEAIVFTGGTSLAPVIFEATKTSCANAIWVVQFVEAGFTAIAAYDNATIITAAKVSCSAFLLISISIVNLATNVIIRISFRQDST